MEHTTSHSSFQRPMNSWLCCRRIPHKVSVHPVASTATLMLISVNVNPWLKSPGLFVLVVPPNNSTWLLKLYLREINSLGCINQGLKVTTKSSARPMTKSMWNLWNFHTSQCSHILNPHSSHQMFWKSHNIYIYICIYIYIYISYIHKSDLYPKNKIKVPF